MNGIEYVILVAGVVVLVVVLAANNWRKNKDDE